MDSTPTTPCNPRHHEPPGSDTNCFVKTHGEAVTWAEYEEAVLKRFGDANEDPMAELKNLRIAPDYEASRAHGFVLRSLELHILSFIMGI
ncbi:hypothetical protein Tco_0559630 [Tanacetum coccineum]